MTLLLIAQKIGLNASIFTRKEISRILHNSFAITWGNSGSHIFSANTDYQLIYTKRTLYNTMRPEGLLYIQFTLLAYALEQILLLQ